LKEIQEARLTETVTKKDLAELELRLVKWVVGTALGTVGIIIGAFFAIIKINQPG
jgi:hypothetical protein